MSEVWEVMWESLPPGFRFRPTDEEFVDHYLMNYILGIRDGVDVIPIVDDLFKRDPSELPRLFRGSSIISSRDPEWWFLSKLKYKSPKSDKFDRSTSSGSWKITGRPKEIYGRGSNRQIAMMRNLVFCENPRNDEINWVIHEYHLCDVSFGLTLCEQRVYVLCHLVNRRHDYAESSASMEVDLELVARQHGFSEELIQAQMISLADGLTSPVTYDASLHDTGHNAENGFNMRLDGPVDCFNGVEQAMSTSGEDDDILNLLNHVVFSTDEESMHSGEFDVVSFFEPLVELEDTSRDAVIKENRQGRTPETLHGYVVINENRGFMEDGHASSVPDSPKDARPKPMASPHERPVSYFRGLEEQAADAKGSDYGRMPVIEQQQIVPPRRYQYIKEAKGSTTKATVMQSAATEPRSSTEGVGRNPGTGSRTLQSEQGSEKMPATSRADDRYRPPFDYLTNLGVGIVLLVLMMLWLIVH